MANAWTAERVWTTDDVRDVIRQQCGDVACQSIEPFGSGWDNAAFLVDDRWIFRFVQRRFAIPLLTREWQILPQLAPRLTIPIPCPRWFGMVGEWPFLGYPRLVGRPASDIRIDDHLRFDLARPLGRFLRELHDQPANEFVIAPDALGRFDIPSRRSRALQMLDECEANVDHSALRQVLDVVDPIPGVLVVSHGDLYARHLLIDGGGLSGVIDWGDVCLTDLAHDLMIAYCFLGPAARAEFLVEYGEISPSTVSRARFRAVCHTLHVHHYAASIGDEPLLAEAILSMSNIIA